MYEGWSNYPTWAVNLWLSNDEGLYRATLNLIAGTADVDQGFFTTAHDARVSAIAEDLRSWATDDLSPHLDASFASDLLTWALREVDWQEIAESWLSDVTV